MKHFPRRRPLNKKQAKKGVFRLFLEKFDQKNAFFWRALPPQKYMMAPKEPLEKF